MGKVSFGNILRDKEYQKLEKKLNKCMITLEESAKNVNIEIFKLKRKYKDKI